MAVARTRDVMIRGCDQGSWLPPVLRPRSRRTRDVTSVPEPRKSMRASAGFVDGFTGMSIRKYTMTVETRMKGTWSRNAQRQESLSAHKPPKTPPVPMPRPKMRFPYPCQRPRRRSGIRSLVTKVVMQLRPPPPIPATTRPAIMTGADGARPQIRVPRAKNRLENRRPVRREKMSVSFPESGWQAELAIR